MNTYVLDRCCRQMFTLLAVFGLIIFAAKDLSAQSTSFAAPWQLQSPLRQSNPDSLFSFREVGMDSFFFLDATTGWAVGRQGNILTTRDGGTTWSSLPSPTRRRIVEAWFANASTGWITGDDGIFATSDGGQTWRLQTDSLDGNALFFLNSTTGWAVGFSGAIFTTINGGQTWTRQILTSPNTVRDVQFVNATTGWVVGTDGVFVSTDGGRTWRNQLSRDSAGATLNNLSFINATTGWVCGDDGRIFTTTNGGVTWTRQTVPAPPRGFDDDVQDIRFFDANNGFAVLGAFTIRTFNGGRTWSVVSEIPTLGFISNVHFVNSSLGFATTNVNYDNSLAQNMLWRTTDGGTTWTQIRSNRVSSLTGSSFVSVSTGWVVGPVATNVTRDGGATWEMQNIPLDTTGGRNFVGIFLASTFLDDNRGWIAGMNGRSAITRDGGRTWQMLRQTNIDDSITGISFVNDRIGLMVSSFHGYNRSGFGFRIYTTSDGGTTWTRRAQSTRADSLLNDARMVNATLGFVVGRGGMILRTTDGGTTWTRQQSGTTQDLRAITFVSAQQGWVVGGTDQTAVILATTDGGTTWTRQVPPTDNTLRDVSFANPLVGWAVGNRGTILATQDGGRTWLPQSINTRSNLNTVGFVSPVRGWVAGDDGIIAATINGGYTPELTTSISRVDFGSASVRDAVDRTITVSGRYLLTPVRVNAPAGFTLDYAGQQDQSSIELSPNQLAATQATITLRFRPTADGAVSGQLSLNSALVTSTIALIGVGVNRPVLRFSQERITFQPTLVRQSSQATLRITNIGTAAGTIGLALTPTGVFSGGSATIQFGQAYPLAAGASVDVPLRFTPQTFGEARAVLSVRLVGSGIDTTITGILTGTGNQAAFRIAPRLLELGSVSLTQSTVASVGITNVGNIAGTVQNLSITGAPDIRFVGANAGANVGANVPLGAGQSLIVQLAYTPTMLGFTRGQIVVRADSNSVGDTAVIFGIGSPLLDVPRLVSPFNRRINVPTSTVFIWATVDGALSYEVQVSRDSTFARVDITNELRSLSYSPQTELLPSTFYFWRVRAKSPTAISEWSTVGRFETVRNNVRLRTVPELVEVSGIAGQPQRGAFAVRSSQRLTISQIRWIQNDNNAYFIRSDQFPMTIQSNVTEYITFDYTAAQPGTLSTARLRLVGSIDSVDVIFIGESVNRDSTMVITRVAVQTDTSNVRPGDTVRVRLVMTEAQNLSLPRNRSKTQSFNAVIRVRNTSVLAISPRLAFPPNLNSNLAISDLGKTITLRNIPRDTTKGERNVVLAEMQAKALLGSSEATAIEFLAFEWNGADDQRSIQSVVDSSVALVVCREGGTRLLQRTQATSLSAVSPNPVKNSISVEFALTERGQTELYVMDMLGKRVKTLMSGTQEPSVYASRFDISDLPDGVYMLVLQTPSEIVQQRIGVVK